MVVLKYSAKGPSIIVNIFTSVQTERGGGEGATPDVHF